jgi:hypothetical protein
LALNEKHAMETRPQSRLGRLMRWRDGSSNESLAVLLAALLLPGGFVLLACLLCRKWLRCPGAQAMARAIAWVALVAVLQGCATQLAVRPGAGFQDPGILSTVAVLRFQRNSIAPESTDDFLEPDALQPGDILHMREGDVSSLRIRKMLREVGHLKCDRPLTVAFQP